MLLHVTVFIWLVLGVTAVVLHERYFHCFRYSLIVAAFFVILSAIFPQLISKPTFELMLLPQQTVFLLQLTPLSRFFVLLLGLSLLPISGFSQTYFRHFSIKQQRVIHVGYAFFVLGMFMVFTAGNSFTFLFAWELMSLSSYILVVCTNTIKIARKAGLLYIGIAHIGFLCISCAFLLLSNPHVSQMLANMVFIFALIGFGAKAGLFPLHVWLPEAHPAAPSPVSALMSGVMLKTAVYGLMCFSFCWLLPWQQAWWGYVLMGFGLMSMLMGVIHALLQTDMKRLLAYSSIEHLGFILLSLGFAIVFYQYQHYVLANISLVIVMLHSLSHSLFKSLLFLCTGSILHATGERNLGKLGGLIQKMPWVSGCALIGCLAMAGLPLFSGFISEWLYLQLFFKWQIFGHFNFAILSIVVVATSVLVFALAGVVAVKFFGIAFLGQARESALAHVKPISKLEKMSLCWLALWSILIGLLPMPFIYVIQAIVTTISGKLTLAWQDIFTISWSAQTAQSHITLTPILLLVGGAVLLLPVLWFIRRYGTRVIRRNISWSCGFNDINPRMQDSAEGFSQPFKQIFSKLIQVRVKLTDGKGGKAHYTAIVAEKIWLFFYYPLIQVLWKVVSVTRFIQQGKISVYLMYVALTLVILLVVVVGL